MSSFSTKKKNHMSIFFFNIFHVLISFIMWFYIKILRTRFLQTPPITFYWTVNFEKLIVRLHVSYVFNMHVECSNRILFTIWSRNLFFMQVYYHKKLKFKHVIDDIVINLWSSWNFASIKNIIRTCNPKS